MEKVPWKGVDTKARERVHQFFRDRGCTVIGKKDMYLLNLLEWGCPCGCGLGSVFH